MKGKVALGVMAVMGLLALSATRAQAGAGGSPSPLTSFFVCKSISGENPNLSVDIDSTDPAGWGFPLQNARIGNATLACAFAKLFPGGSTHCTGPDTPPGCSKAIEPNPDQDLGKSNLKCYAISVARGQIGGSPPPSYTVTDQLLGEDPNVTGSSLQYVCAPAKIQENVQ
jgi:hypothetical protein